MQIEKNITIKYTLALLIIAMLSTLSFYVLYKSLQESSETSYIVNIAGKQRMFSQHLALDAYRLKDTKTNKYESDSIKKHFLGEIQEMKETNSILSSGKLPNGERILVSKKVHEIYFGTLNLKKHIDNFADLLTLYITLKDTRDLEQTLQKIDRHSMLLLSDLEKLVKLYEQEGSKKLLKLKTLEIIAWVLVIFILLLEIIFIFQPIVKKVAALLKENSHVLQNLEQEVELRTLKLQEANRALKELASHDPMTGLKNRLTLEDDVEIAIENFIKFKAPFALLMFDIDWFKDVNDTYGHDVGDSVIKGVAKVLLSSVRAEDKVYRAGGEEFVILLSRISLEDSEEIANKIRLLIEETIFEAEGEHFGKTISAGLYHSSIASAKSIFHVLKLVDGALYESKEKGRNRVTKVSDI